MKNRQRLSKDHTALRDFMAAPVKTRSFRLAAPARFRAFAHQTPTSDARNRSGLPHQKAVAEFPKAPNRIDRETYDNEQSGSAIPPLPPPPTELENSNSRPRHKLLQAPSRVAFLACSNPFQAPPLR
jgi:hypothetical protein